MRRPDAQLLYFMYENKRRNKFVIEYPKLFATDRHW